jgi:hypothetical protein
VLIEPLLNVPQLFVAPPEQCNDGDPHGHIREFVDARVRYKNARLLISVLLTSPALTTQHPVEKPGPETEPEIENMLMRR